jgi:hypothetical protein
MTIANLISISKFSLKMLLETGDIQSFVTYFKSPNGYITVARLYTVQ